MILRYKDIIINTDNIGIICKHDMRYVDSVSDTIIEYQILFDKTPIEFENEKVRDVQFEQIYNTLNRR